MLGVTTTEGRPHVPDQVLTYPDPPLTDGTFGLRPWRENDIDCVRQAALDPSIPAGTTVPAVFTPQDGLEFIRRQHDRAVSGAGIYQAIVDQCIGTAIGLLWLGVRPQPHVAGLGYWLVPAARGRGAAVAAVRLMVPWAFGQLQLHRIEAWVDPGNVVSQKVLIGAGFQLEGRLRNFLTADAGPSDALVFSTIPSLRKRPERASKQQDRA